MAGANKLMTSGGGGVIITPATNIAADVTVNVPSVNGDVVLTNIAGTVSLAATGANIITASTNGSERMRIDSSGNLLVATVYNNPIAVRTNGTAINVPGSIPMTIRNGSTQLALGLSITSGTHIQFYTDNGTTFVGAGGINSNGSTTTYATSSDYRMKTDVQPMVGALNKVMQLNPVTYKWIDGLGGTKQFGQGFIAHELQAVVPDCVTGEKDAVDAEGKPVYQGIDTSFLVATLTKAIQEQQAQIETLTAKVAALEAK